MHFIVISSSAQTVREKYDLNFKNITSCSRAWLSSGNPKFSVDTANINENKPAFKLYYNNRARDKNMQCNLSRIILLPKIDQPKECEVLSKKVQNFVNLFLKPNETAVVYAHSGHITSLAEMDSYLNADLSLGFYLRKIYQDQYFFMSFQIGEGTYSQDECSMSGKIVSERLLYPPAYSFEYAGLATGLNYFYYPSKHLGDAILSYGKISRESRHADLYRFSSLKKRFDAYVFIKESKPIEEVESFPMIYNMRFFESKRKAMYDVLKEIEF